MLAESEIGDGVDCNKMSPFSYSCHLCTGCWMYGVTGGPGWKPPVGLTAAWKTERWRTSLYCLRTLILLNTTSTYSCDGKTVSWVHKIAISRNKTFGQTIEIQVVSTSVVLRYNKHWENQINFQQSEWAWGRIESLSEDTLGLKKVREAQHIK